MLRIGVWLALGIGSALAADAPPTDMIKMVVRLSGPGIKAGSFAALPRTIYRAGEHFARVEDPPNTREQMEKLTIIAEPDAYSINLISRKGTHANDPGGPNDLHLPIVLPFDPNHRLGKLDLLEFGEELAFFEEAKAAKKAGPAVNAKPTDEYELDVPGGKAKLVVKAGTSEPIFMSWPSKEGTYRYEYMQYQTAPFEPALFTKPAGVTLQQLPAATGREQG